LKVRTFAIGDYSEVRKLWIASGLEIRAGDELQGVRRMLARDRGLFLVAEDEGEIVGTVMGAWDGRRGWIYHLGVRPDRHRTGVATRLVRELEARMRKMGIPKVNAMIYPWNDASLRFFSSAGYYVEDMKEAQKWLDKEPPTASRRHPPRAGPRPLRKPPSR